MKDNPVQRLDLLEAQLSRVESKDSEAVGRLSRTRHLLERLEKSQGLQKDASLLRAEIHTVKQEIVQRKLFYAINVIKRFLRQFKKVEPLRIVKRLKAADSPEKRTMLETELELVNKVDADQWASDIAYRGLAKRFDVLRVTGTAFSKRALTTPEINVLGRVGKNEAVHGAILKLVENVTEYFEPMNKDNTQESPSIPTSEQKAGPGAKSTPIVQSASQFSSKPASQSLSEAGNDHNSRHMADEEEFTKFDSEEEGSPGDNEPEVDPFFESVDGTDGGLPLGLPVLQQGYISGSDDDSEPEPEPEPARRNRRGQRARRKIWEQKFGKRANHVLKQEREQQKELEAKESRKRRREEKVLSAKRQRIEQAAKPLHPSWEARQQEKQKQTQVKFEGKKMRFD